MRLYKMSQSYQSGMPAPPSQSGGIPDLMKIGSIPINTAQEVETKILEPVVKTNKHARFVFDNSGLLHSHSKVEIGLKQPPVDCMFPPHIGAYSLIQRVALKVGNQTLSELDDFADYYAYRSMFVANENQKEREVMTTGRMMSHQLCYQGRTTTDGGDESDNVATGIGLDNGMEYDETGVLLDGTADLPLKPEQELQYEDTLMTSGPLYQLSLSELVPFLRHNQLPLYLFKEQVALEITFTDTGSANYPSGRVVVRDGVASTGSFEIDTDTLRLISDHIFYPQELMVQYANANKVLNFTYADYRLSKYSRTSDDFKSQQIRNIGGAGRIVSKIIWGVSSDAENNTNLLNKYGAIAPARDYSTGGADDVSRKNGEAVFNIKYNDTFEYPIDLDLPARMFHNITQSEGLVPFITREEYSKEGVSTTSRTILGLNQSSGLAGHFFWCANKLGKGERINSRGIELYFKLDELSATGTDVFVQRVYLEVMRTATLTNGYMECYYA